MTFTNLAYKIHYTRGNDIASAATLPLFSDGDYFHVTGASTISRLADLGKGMQVVLKFDESLVMEHDDEYLILSLGEDMVINPGDTLRFVQYDSGGKWRMINDGSGGIDPEQGEFQSPKSRATKGDRVDVNGDFTSDLTGWSGTNWAWDASYGGCAKHTAGSTDPLVGTVPVEVDKYYYGEVEIADNNGVIAIEIGIFKIPRDEDNFNFNDDGVFTGGLRAYSTGDADVKIYPNSGFTGSINYIRFYEVVQAAPAVLIYDQDDVDALDILADDELDNQFMGAESGFQSVDGSDNICFGKNAGESLVTGSYNTFVGKDAGEDCSMGDFNVAIGSNAGAQIITGCANTLIGTDAGQAIIDGMRNTCIGRKSGYAITTGDNNTLVGPHSGTAITDGVDNTCLGPYTGYAITDSSRNTLIGSNAGRNMIDGDENVFIGVSVGQNADDSYRNIGIGLNCLYQMTGSTDNLAIGRLAGYTLQTGDHNVILGNNAAFSITTGSANIIAGYQAGFDMTTASNTIAIGNEALTNLTTGNDNIGIGTNSLHALTTGTENVCIGDDSGHGITTNNFNVCFGAGAGYTLAGGDYNVLLGRSTMYLGVGESNVVIGDEACASGSGTRNENVCIGDSAAKALTTGDNNVMLGNHAGDKLLTTDDNVMIGDFAGSATSAAGNNTSSAGCIYIGAGSKSYGVNDSNNIVIGTNAESGTGSNNIVLGNSSHTTAQIYGRLFVHTGQVQYPTTQNPSTDVNCLDDYEEGTFTPGIAFGSGTTGIVYAYQVGKYTKVGDMVTATGRVSIVDNGSSSGNLWVTGLPFTSNSTSFQKNAAAVTTFNLASSGFITGRVSESDTRIEMFECNTAGTRSNLTDTDTSNTTGIEFMVVYYI